MDDNKLTYISLFSSAGVGCFGFKMQGFECIATNELIERRLEIQKFNKKCKYETGYICGDITKDETKDLLYGEIKRWEKNEHVKRVDVVIATPPCQGMSVANHKKHDDEILRNSLVVESIKIIKQIHPKFFIFENVPAFMKTACTDIDGYDKPIGDAIKANLGDQYSYYARVINFKDFGACSSRTRTVVIGVSKDYADEISPIELYPMLQEEKTLRQVIGNMKSLKVMGEIDPEDIYHSFRSYPEHMRAWISDLKEGQGAFDNEDDEKKPHQVIDGKIVLNKQKNADKYTRQFWDKVGPCVHTRNDQLASQSTVHPLDDRVFSIRELMRMMTIPDDFMWSQYSVDYLNKLSEIEKKQYLKKEEIKIRQSLGEAVPTIIFYQIAANLKRVLSHKPMNAASINKIVDANNFENVDELIHFIEENPLNLSVSALGRIAELSNTNRTDDAAFYTNKALITEMFRELPVMDKDTITILEPSVGVGNFIPIIFKKFEGKKLVLDLVDIDENSTRIAEVLLKKYGIPENCTINFIVDDFLLHDFAGKHYDYVIGNPPFYKMGSGDVLLKEYQSKAKNNETTNICSFFLDKIVDLADYISVVFPKFILNTPEFKKSREYLKKRAIECIVDFGEKGFPGVLIETIAIFINNSSKIKDTKVISITHGIEMIQKQSHITDNAWPYWIIYRDELFDTVAQKLEFGVFSVFRDRQITNANSYKEGDIRIIKSRNISDDGKELIDIPDYDAYVKKEDANQLAVYDYIDNDNVYLTPNMTYKPRVMKKPKGVIVNGSVAILIPKDGRLLTESQMLYFSSDEYRKFYQVARNYQTRSLNVDTCSVYFYGVLKEDEGGMS